MPIVAVGDKRYELSEVLASDRLDALFSDAWTGSRVWNASIFLSKQLLRLYDERQFITTAQQSVIELGSGWYAHTPISLCINPIYGVDSWRNLARSIRDLGSSTTVRWVCYLSYEERGDNAALADFHACSRDYLTHELVLQEGKIHFVQVGGRRMVAANKIVVCDNGTGFVKCGFAAENFPRHVFPSLVGRPILRAEEAINRDVILKDVMCGDEAAYVRSNLQISYPVENGIVKNWDDMEKLWDYTFHERLQVNPKEMRILLTEPPLNPKANREKLVEMMFEKYGFEGTHISIQAMLTLYAQGLRTGVVIDSGDGVSHVVPVYEGFVPQHLIRRLDVAGRHITQYLIKLLLLRGYAFNRTADFETVRQIKERHCYTALDPVVERRLSLETTVLEETYELPDGRVIKLGRERFEAAEALFQPHLIGVEGPGLSDMLFEMCQKADIDLRTEFYKNIVLSGGSSMYPGLPSRLEKDIKDRYCAEVLKGDKARLSKFRLRINDPPRRKHLVFLGGSVLANFMKDVDEFWISKKEYDEQGVRCIDKLKAWVVCEHLVMEQYTRIRLLGEGSFGRVFLMRENAVDGGGLVCVKDIPVLHVSSSKKTRRGGHSSSDGLNEAHLMQKLRHPNLIAYRDSFESTNHRHLFIVMEYCSGGDLHAKLQRKQAKHCLESETNVCLWLVQLCLGLHCMHHRRIMHRSELDRDDLAHTTVGTPNFMSPELLDGTYSYASDVWALGCVLYEMCTLHFPFEAKTTPALVAKICAGDYAPLDRKFSPDLRRLQDELLAVDAWRRPSLQSILTRDFLRPALECYVTDVVKCGSYGYRIPMIPQTVVSPESPRCRPPPTPDPEWRPPVQSKPPPSTSFLSSAHLDTSTCFSSAFRKGVNLTPHAKPYLAQACKDVRVLRRSVYAQAAHARNHVAAHMVLSSSPPKGLPGDSIEDAAVATPDEVDAALLQYQRDVERRLRRHSAINQ
ncbi:hypothetical protein DYB31_010327 [Aphanomyces astaci]|uniref:Actin-related protein 2 n=1 Tax=Aphanomyces astaci TaxID=112090 RepID=A0A397FKI0_APHAT|nr:hypothetical protein DYB31_010327 [Aphanomyces astaci]